MNFEVVVVDNASNGLLRLMLLKWHRSRLIDKLCLLNYNSLFAEGNNIASRLANPHSTHLLLLNSDVEIRGSDWLRLLLDAHKPGISSYGVVHGHPITRVDGYCLLIDSVLYHKRLLDESFEWWWSITKLQAEILAAGFSVQGFENHEHQLHHFGGKSGDDFRGAKGMNVAPELVKGWFKEKNNVQVFDTVAYDSGCPQATSSV